MEIRIPSPYGRPLGFERWELCLDLFCPSCGQKDTCFMGLDGDDYYVGETYLCTGCANEFYMPIQKANEHSEIRIRFLREENAKA